jgi:hypothetical protein
MIFRIPFGTLPKFFFFFDALLHKRLKCVTERSKGNLLSFIKKIKKRE